MTTESQTIKEFCRDEKISRCTFHKMQRLGLGPVELRIPGTNVVRITAMARREWHQRMAELAQHEAARIEQARRVELAREAGRAAARSALHVSRRPPRNRGT